MTMKNYTPMNAWDLWIGTRVWEYRSFWNWASASGYLPDGSTLGLNLGKGFGD
jgi:hypothetical protein